MCKGKSLYVATHDVVTYNSLTDKDRDRNREKTSPAGFYYKYRPKQSVRWECLHY
jgi:hypothetical protein